MPDMQHLPHGAHYIAPDVHGRNFYAIDRQFQDLMRLYMEPGLRAAMTPHFERLGALAGGRLDELAMTADKHPPMLQPRDRFGRDEDWIDYHPAYREMEKIAFEEFGMHAMSHRAGVLGMAGPAHPLVKYAITYLFVQGEFGLMCPVSVSDTSNFIIKRYGSPALKKLLLDRLLSQDPATMLKGTQFMTEKAGGSDVGALETEAEPVGVGADGVERWKLHGQKWFCSHADADVAVLLARVRDDLVDAQPVEVRQLRGGQTAHSPSPRWTTKGTLRFQSMNMSIVSIEKSTAMPRSFASSSKRAVPTRSAYSVNVSLSDARSASYMRSHRSTASGTRLAGKRSFKRAPNFTVPSSKWPPMCATYAGSVCSPTLIDAP
jgi:hypothetical protein